MGISWLSTMPEPDLSLGFGEEYPPLEVSEMETGPPQVRGRSNAVVSWTSCGYVLDQAQDAAFDAWHRDVALFGALPVDDWPHPRRKVPVRALILRNDVKRSEHMTMYVALMLTKVYVLS